MRGFLIYLSLLSPLSQGCASSEDVFTDGRIESRCNGSIPICNSQASCVLHDDQYLQDDFPGGKTFMVHTKDEVTLLIARVLLIEPRYTGTELVVRVHGDTCGDYEEGATRDRDLFEVAGEDSIIEYALEITRRGDHLVELYSDMSSEFMFRFDHEKSED